MFVVMILINFMTDLVFRDLVPATLIAIKPLMIVKILHYQKVELFYLVGRSLIRSLMIHTVCLLEAFH